ncbi:hypothetical protein NP493_195g02014 [Ridgeia piscesae]|uniref:Uncharacterized protein n=1 Tax=Ridgeia piscesae TaxID=27915 RepID=A0AAD9P251_RIDPI|nr:hypothetical protein NP493_195g02014 [Ridgeia piscesae]
MQINCSTGGVVYVISAFYGHVDKTTFRDDIMKTTLCTTGDCQEQTCDVDDSLLTSRYGTNQYLIVTYECRVDCLSQPCQNGATCVHVTHGFTCVYPEHYSGSTCSEITLLKCESDTIHISCPSGSVVDVISAFYGRLDLTTCQHRSMKSTSCSLSGATDAVRTICQDKTTCDVKSSSFSDPCYGTYKYMNVTYECRHECQSQPCQNGATCVHVTHGFTCVCPGNYSGETCSEITLLKCENDEIHINCPSGSVVDVISAFYGRLDLTTCQHRSMKSTSCSLSGATDAVRTICQDKTTCDVKSSSFSDPCRGTYKYMNVTYECRPDECHSQPCQNGATCVHVTHGFTCVCPENYSGETCSEITLLKCEIDKIHINCPSGSDIDVISAFYGRLDLTTCQHISMKSTSCSLPGVTDAVRTICQDKTTCDVKSSLFSDPCRGTYKYMNVTYECRPRKSDIGCSSSSTATFAFYGRRNKATCPDEASDTTTCSVPGCYGQSAGDLPGQDDV